MNADFEARLKAQVDFPSPSHVAGEVIALARNPDAEISKVAQAIGHDPAMAAKLLRIANSAFYAQRRPSQNIRQALIVIGLNAALTLALSFSLVSTLRACKPNGIDYRRYWRRALLAASASRVFAELVCKEQDEEVFLAGLLQDVAILAIDRSIHDFYSALPSHATHEVIIGYEQQRLDMKDHAHYGALLLRTWNIPESICATIEHSHNAVTLENTSHTTLPARCVYMGSELAEVILATDRGPLLIDVANKSQALLGLNDEQFTAVLTRTFKLIPETEALYETSVLDASDAEAMLAQAQELTTIRNYHVLQETQRLQDNTTALLMRNEQLENASQRDALTETLNRTCIDDHLEREYTQAMMLHRPLSVALLDIDHFKSINDRIGHDNGNTILKCCAQTIQTSVRGSDLVGRYGGDKFLVLLPGTDTNTAVQVCERIKTAVREMDLPTSTTLDNNPLKVTLTIGIATHTPQHCFTNSTELTEAADHALYAAKLRGRNCVEYFDNLPQSVRHINLTTTRQ